MAFKFPLEAVFHYRKSVEHQQELRLRTATQHVSRARHLLEQIDVRQTQMRTNRSQQLENGTTSAELYFGAMSESALGEQRQKVVVELNRLQKLRDQQFRIFQHARREREVFENLRDHQLREYKLDAARREQRDLDDLFLLRRSNQGRGQNLPRT
jgi:flagellar export protein FliJ